MNWRIIYLVWVGLHAWDKKVKESGLVERRLRRFLFRSNPPKAHPTTSQYKGHHNSSHRSHKQASSQPRIRKMAAYKHHAFSSFIILMLFPLLLQFQFGTYSPHFSILFVHFYCIPCQSIYQSELYWSYKLLYVQVIMP